MAPHFEFDKPGLSNKPGLSGRNICPHVKDGEDAALAHKKAAEVARNFGVTVKEVGIDYPSTPGKVDSPCQTFPHEYGPDGKPVV